MKKLVLGLTPALLLASCGKGDVDLKNASVEEVAEATKDQQKLEPGQWRSTIEIVSVDFPGVPEKEKAVASQMFKRMIGQKQTNEHCITKEQADKPPAEMMSGGNNACRFDHFQLGDNNMDAKMSCSAKGSEGGMSMTMKGPFGGQKYALDMNMETGGAPGMPKGAKMIIHAKNSGERIGNCKAPAAPAAKGG